MLMVLAGQARSFSLYVPSAYVENQPAPLVISLHGYGSNGIEMARLSALSIKADAEGFVVVYPNGVGVPPHWAIEEPGEDADDIAFRFHP